MQDLIKIHPEFSFIDENGFLHICDEDASIALIKNIDLYSQRIAIIDFVNSMNSVQRKNQVEISKIESICKNASRLRSNFLIDELINSYHFSIYSHSTYSMAVLGMTAPIIESLFYEIFKNIGELMEDKFSGDNEERLHCIKKRIIWDCHFVVKNGKMHKNIVNGIKQLAEFTGFNEFLPSDYYSILDALIYYRNMMFHDGLEWQNENTEKFKHKLETSNWPKNWFDCSKRNDTPWIYFMTTIMIERCLKFINEIEVAAGSYYIEKIID